MKCKNQCRGQFKSHKVLKPYSTSFNSHWCLRFHSNRCSTEQCPSLQCPCHGSVPAGEQHCPDALAIPVTGSRSHQACLGRVVPSSVCCWNRGEFSPTSRTNFHSMSSRTSSIQCTAIATGFSLLLQNEVPGH